MKNTRSAVCEVPDCFFIKFENSLYCERHDKEAQQASKEAEEINNFSYSFSS